MAIEDLKARRKKLQSIHKVKVACKREWRKYKKLFKEDGTISKEEQRS